MESAKETLKSTKSYGTLERLALQSETGVQSSVSHRERLATLCICMHMNKILVNVIIREVVNYRYIRCLSIQCAFKRGGK